MRRRITSLDGLRAVAVLFVMAYHGGVPGLATAGFYGVDVFFVLSGFLITSILLEGRWSLAGFWGRRARRLLPALGLMVVAVAAYVHWMAPPGRYPGFGADLASVVGYVSNWHFVVADSNYFASTAAPSLLTHTWSLAVEEQFYVVWPLVVLALGRNRRLVGLSAGVGALASTAWMAFLYAHGASQSRLYYGTDTHAQGLLVGATLAAWGGRLPRWAGWAGLTALVLAAIRLGAAGSWAWQGGFLAVAIAAAAVVGSAGQGGLLDERLLGTGPLPVLGRISYAMYLWYLPVFSWLDSATTRTDGLALFGLRCAGVIALAAVSQWLVERPARRLALPRSAAVLLAVPAAVAVLALSAPTAPPSPSLAAAIVAGGPSPPGHGERVLVTGDSTGLTLGMAMALPQVQSRWGTEIDDAAQLGCGLVLYAAVYDAGVARPAPPACDPDSKEGLQWPAELAAQVRRFRPQVVLVSAGRWEMLDRRASPGAAWSNILEPADARYVASQLELMVAIAGSSGARVVLLTAPCYSSGEQPNGRPWPADDPRRRAVYNNLLREAARRHPGQVTVADTAAAVCPGGHFTSHIGPVTVRAPDGVHYPFFDVYDPTAADPDTVSQVTSFGDWITAKLMALGAL